MNNSISAFLMIASSLLCFNAGAFEIYPEKSGDWILDRESESHLIYDLNIGDASCGKLHLLGLNEDEIEDELDALNILIMSEYGEYEESDLGDQQYAMLRFQDRSFLTPTLEFLQQSGDTVFAQIFWAFQSSESRYYGMYMDVEGRSCQRAGISQLPGIIEQIKLGD